LVKKIIKNNPALIQIYEKRYLLVPSYKYMKIEKENNPSKRIKNLIPDRDYEEIMQIKSAGEKLEKNEIQKWWRSADKERKDSEGKFVARDAGKFDGANIKGWAVGEQIKDGVYTGRLCITVYTQFKVSPELIEEDTILPPVYEGQILNVVETGPITSGLALVNPFIDPKRRFRPVTPGVSISHPMVTAGTLGCYCSTNDEEDLVLSNNHVLAASNNAKKKDKILQPGTIDHGDPTRDSVGELYDWVSLNFKGKVNSVDAALGTISNNDDIKTEILNIGSVR
jgi:hypothetical protein